MKLIKTLLFLFPGVLALDVACAPSGHPPTLQELKAIQAATQQGDKPQVEKLIRANPRIVNAKDDAGWTPLHIAAARGAVEIARLLVARGAEVNATERDAKTPLHEAARNGNVSLAEILLANGAQIGAKDRGTYGTLHAGGRTPLQWAAWYGHAGMTAFLLEKGADPNARDDEGQTSLHLWAHSGSSEGVAEALLAKGADVNARTTEVGHIYTADLSTSAIRATSIPRGTTPLGVAGLAGDEKKASFLHAHGGEK